MAGGHRAPLHRTLRRRDGRRAHLRTPRGTARRDIHRRHDSRLGSSAIRLHGEGEQRDNKQGARRKPRML